MWFLAVFSLQQRQAQLTSSSPGIPALTGFCVLLMEVLLPGLYPCHFQVFEMHRDSSFHHCYGQCQSQPLGVKLVLVALVDVLWRLCEKP